MSAITNFLNSNDSNKEKALRALLQEELMNYEMVAAYLGKSRTTIRRYIQEKRFEPIINKPQFQVFLKSDVDAYLKEQQH
ncbi:MAG: Helix-turn-helix domain [Neobacillus sp.]|jgi:predicted DNA-binding transcriptional regulator AlpA|nr:Helix-turn-helix domain [Neobacillus sp.]